MQIVQDDLTGPKILELLRVHAEDMLAKSPPGACHFLDLDGLRAPDVTFWTSWIGGGLRRRRGLVSAFRFPGL